MEQWENHPDYWFNEKMEQWKNEKIPRDGAATSLVEADVNIKVLRVITGQPDRSGATHLLKQGVVE